MQKDDIQSILNILFGIDIPPSKWKVISTNRHVVLSFGEVVSLIRKPRILKKTLSNAGYYYVSIMKNGKHRLNNCRLELHHSSKLTIDDVIKIRKEVGGATHYQIAKKYSTSRSNIGKILSGKAWKI